MTYTQVDPNTWQAKKNNENERDIHPCDEPLAEQCMCKGACSCHWVEQPITTHTTEPAHIKNVMLDLCENWESIASEFRERAEKSRTANGLPNPEVCRAIAVGLEQCARDVRKVIKQIPEHTVLYPSKPPDTLRTGETPEIPNTLPNCNHNNVAPGSWCHICGKRMPL